jgi:hypothetical protein
MLKGPEVKESNASVAMSSDLGTIIVNLAEPLSDSHIGSEIAKAHRITHTVRPFPRLQRILSPPATTSKITIPLAIKAALTRRIDLCLCK